MSSDLIPFLSPGKWLPPLPSPAFGFNHPLLFLPPWPEVCPNFLSLGTSKQELGAFLTHRKLPSKYPPLVPHCSWAGNSRGWVLLRMGVQQHPGVQLMATLAPIACFFHQPHPPSRTTTSHQWLKITCLATSTTAFPNGQKLGYWGKVTIMLRLIIQCQASPSATGLNQSITIQEMLWFCHRENRQLRTAWELGFSSR